MFTLSFYFILAVATYMVYSFNLSCLTYLIEEGYFNHPFWTRTLRSMFLAPPLALIIFSAIFFIESIKWNIKNLGVVLKRRED